MERCFYLERWPKVREGLLRIVDDFTENDLPYIPVAGGWSVGRIILHISSAANYWLHSGILSDIAIYQSGKANLSNFPTLAAIKAFLADEHQRTMSLLSSFSEKNWERRFSYPDGNTYTPAWVFWHVLEHEIHHRGEVSLVSGQIGKLGLDV